MAGRPQEPDELVGDIAAAASPAPGGTLGEYIGFLKKRGRARRLAEGRFGRGREYGLYVELCEALVRRAARTARDGETEENHG